MCKGLLGVLLGMISRTELGEQDLAEGEVELQRIELMWGDLKQGWPFRVVS